MAVESTSLVHLPPPLSFRDAEGERARGPWFRASRAGRREHVSGPGGWRGQDGLLVAKDHVAAARRTAVTRVANANADLARRMTEAGIVGREESRKRSEAIKGLKADQIETTLTRPGFRFKDTLHTIRFKSGVSHIFRQYWWPISIMRNAHLNS